MPLFRCTHCDSVENTALSPYWELKAKGLPVLCSECGRGQWHDRFPKEKFDPNKWVISECDYLTEKI